MFLWTLLLPDTDPLYNLIHPVIALGHIGCYWLPDALCWTTALGNGSLLSCIPCSRPLHIFVFWVGSKMERKKWKQEDIIVSVSSRLGPPKLQGKGRRGKKKRRKGKRKDFKEEENGEHWFKSALQARWAGGWELGKPLFAGVMDTENPHHLLPRKAFSASVIYSPTPSFIPLSSFSFLAISVSPFTLLICSLFLSPVRRTAQCQAAAQRLLHEFMDASHLICKDF